MRSSSPSRNKYKRESPTWPNSGYFRSGAWLERARRKRGRGLRDVTRAYGGLGGGVSGGHGTEPVHSATGPLTFHGGGASSASPAAGAGVTGSTTAHGLPV